VKEEFLKRGILAEDEDAPSEETSVKEKSG
jgi:hypothetical protein